MPTFNEVLQEALRLHQQGDHVLAEKLCRTVLAKIEAWTMPINCSV